MKDATSSLCSDSNQKYETCVKSFAHPMTKPPDSFVNFLVFVMLSPVILFLVVISVPVNLIMCIFKIFTAPFIYRRLRALERDNWIEKKGELYQNLTKDGQDIIIIGGGIGGLSMAHFLLRCGFKVKVFEKHSDCGINKGGGHGLIAGKWCYDKMGMHQLYKDICNPAHTWTFDSGRWWLKAKIFLQPMFHSNIFLPSIRFKIGAFVRSDFLKYLADTLPPNVLYLNHDIEKVVTLSEKQHQMNGVKATFTNGVSFNGGIIIGCDGSNSKVRSQIFREKVGQPLYIDINVWWSVTPISAISSSDRALMDGFSWEAGPHRLYFESGAVMHLIANDQIILIVDYRATSVMKDQKNWASNTTNAQFLQFMETWKIPSKFFPVAKYASRVSHFGIPKGLSGHFENWHKGRTVLLGDAVHPTPHFFGQGANAAIQDAYCLTRFLCTANDLETAFKSYVAIRRPPANDIVSKSYLLGMTETAGGIARVVRDLIFFTVLKTGLFTWPSVDIMSIRV